MPTAQFSHFDAPDVAENVPALHTVHWAAASVENMPALHAVHADSPAVDHFPAAQTVHVEDEADAANLPAMHDVQP